MRAADVEATLRARLQWAAGRPLELDPRRSWAVFKELLEEPISDAGMEDDLASFQCGQRQWDDGAVGPCVYFTRQFTQRVGVSPAEYRRVRSRSDDGVG